MIKVVLADDHKVVLQGLSALLEEHHDIDVVGQAHDGLEVLNLVEKLKPDVLVLDWMMPNLNGLEVEHGQRKNGGRRPNGGLPVLWRSIPTD